MPPHHGGDDQHQRFSPNGQSDPFATLMAANLAQDATGQRMTGTGGGTGISLGLNLQDPRVSLTPLFDLGGQEGLIPQASTWVGSLRAKNKTNLQVLRPLLLIDDVIAEREQ